MDIAALYKKAARLKNTIEATFIEAVATAEDESYLDDLYYELALINEKIDRAEEKNALARLENGGLSNVDDFLLDAGFDDYDAGTGHKGW